MPMSILLTADYLAGKYIFQDGCRLDMDVCCDLLKDKGEVSENIRAYEYILSEVSINVNKFVPDDDGQTYLNLYNKDYVLVERHPYKKIESLEVKE